MYLDLSLGALIYDWMLYVNVCMLMCVPHCIVNGEPLAK